MKRLLLVLFFLSQWCVAQDFSDNWEAFFSYSNIVDMEQSGNLVYAASDNSIFVYDTVLETFETITTVNGLSGETISQIHYSEAKNLLVIAYENGLLQIVPENGDVINVVAIRDKQTISPADKSVNEFLESGDLLYLATDFGIAIYNLELLEFDDTYFIGDNGAQLIINSIDISGGFIYAATNGGGIRRASISNPFLLDFMNWTQINADVWEEMTAFNNTIYAVTAGRFVAAPNFTGSFGGIGSQLPSRARDAHVSLDRITYATRDFVLIYDTTFTEIFRVDDINGESFNYTSAILIDDELYIGTETAGMIRVNLSNPMDYEFIIADGPAFNSVFSVQTLPNELWVTYGAHNVFYSPDNSLRGISHLVEEGWINYSSAEVGALRSIPNVTINPDNPNDLVIHSMNDGLLNFIDGVAGVNYNINNSTLEGIEPPFNLTVRIPDGQYDSQGNLWVIQPQVELALHKRTPSGQWTAYDVGAVYDEVTNGSSVTKMEITSNDKIIFGSTDGGLVGYDPAMNLFSRLTEGLQEGNLVNNYVSSLRIDQRGQLWIGSNLGLRILSSANSLFSDNISDARAVIIEDINDIPRELLADEAVLDIEVDGNNNKWVATGSSGVFLFNPSGRETIFQFTKDNSPLPDNEVRDIAIDEASGLVYFATKNGLVAFKGDRASKPQDDLENVFAFPNPVRPGFEGNVTIDGLTNRARVKITDIEGNLVFEKVSQGGSILWDTRSFAGNKVASGVYMLFISTDDNIETTVSKIMVIR
ncbi:MAG: two-component regulator propeller domain-containing protein [Nonlabens sp.]|uniref:type IX secretion system anionic LPS delivery protein PorZ n=1 Tax=Nonlabens sp. TaxID=1888209 RepID=UPI003EF299A3